MSSGNWSDRIRMRPPWDQLMQTRLGAPTSQKSLPPDITACVMRGPASLPDRRADPL
jgi:hypothetical protein